MKQTDLPDLYSASHNRHFPLEGTLKEHFNNSKHKYRNVIETIKNDMNIDDSVLGECILSEMEKVKQQSINCFQKVVLIYITSTRRSQY